MQKSNEFWVVVAVMTSWLLTRNTPGKHFGLKVVEVACSGTLGVVLADDLADYMGFSNELAAVLIMAFGLLLIEKIIDIISDNDLVSSIIAKYLKK